MPIEQYAKHVHFVLELTASFAELLVRVELCRTTTGHLPLRMTAEQIDNSGVIGKRSRAWGGIRAGGGVGVGVGGRAGRGRSSGAAEALRTVGATTATELK